METDPRDRFVNGLNEPLKEILRKQQIVPGNPGPILLDLQTLIDAISEGIPTSSKYFALPQGRLDELNQRLSEPLKHGLKRPQLKSFPTLMGLHLLLRASGLVVGETKPMRMLIIDPAMLQQWNSLNATERYISLLESWLLKATWGAVGERASLSEGLQPEIGPIFMQLGDRITKLDDDRYGLSYGITNAATLALLHQFGWIRLTHDSNPAEGKTASIRFIERLPFGDAMFAATCSIGSFPRGSSAQLQETLRPFFPEWNRSLEIPEIEFQKGEYTLKLSLGKVWRRLVTPAETTLEEVADILLDAFEFDHDHLYQCEFRDRQGKQVQAVCPIIEDAEAFADEIRLGDLPLDEGDVMTFLFDFGDNWKFKVLIEEVSESPSRRSGPKITRRSGSPPKQYHHGDSDD